MLLNPVERERTKEIIKNGNIDIKLESFALKIFLQQLSVLYKLKNDDETLEASVDKLENFFMKMLTLDAIRKDFEKLYRRSLNV